MEYSSLGVFIGAVVMGGICAYTAKRRSKNPYTWFALGAIFGVFALIALVFFTQKTEEPEPIKTPDAPLSMNSENVAYQDSNAFPTPTLRVSRDTSLDWYFIDSQSQIQGPLKLTNLRKTLIEKKYDNETYIWCDEFPDWAQIKTLQNGAMLLDPDFL